ncbi:hypothetical protein H0H81_001112 [Sphagnurus paluster]|uniref:Uncharacterized protein n=1 Tax=Sphagnurus paluster TaxID=117069 RepID=A0A9P7FXM9_9AGAR|nr:hypothetical protein H0H81_001112 [Sphagnurus paluster]
MTLVLDDHLPEPASAIRFGYDYAPNQNQDQMFLSYAPVAFYHLARLPPYVDDDHDSRMNPGFFWDIDGIVRSAKRGLLTRRQLMCLMIRIDALRMTFARFAFKGFPTAVAKDDMASKAEKRVVRKWWTEVGVKKMVGPNDMSNPLARMRELVEELRTSAALLEGVSSGFRERMRVVLELERQKLWDEILTGEPFSLSMYFYSED